MERRYPSVRPGPFVDIVVALVRAERWHFAVAEVVGVVELARKVPGEGRMDRRQPVIAIFVLIHRRTSRSVLVIRAASPTEVEPAACLVAVVRRRARVALSSELGTNLLPGLPRRCQDRGLISWLVGAPHRLSNGDPWSRSEAAVLHVELGA